MLLLEDHTKYIRTIGRVGEMELSNGCVVKYEDVVYQNTPFKIDMDGFALIETKNPSIWRGRGDVQIR